MPAPREPSLEDMQAFLAGAFQRAVPIGDDAALAEACGRHVSGNDRLTPAEQVDIYRRQFWLRHLDSIAEDHPGLAYVLGDEVFETFCRAYLVAHPPHTPSLRDLTAKVADFAAGWDGFPADKRDLAVDMARYEVALVDVFDGPHVAPLAAEKLASVPEDAWDRARIVLHPGLARLRLRYPVQRVRYAIRDGQRPELPEAARVQVVVFRPELTIQYEELEPMAFDVLEALAAGEPLAPAVARVAAAAGGAAEAELEQKVGKWFERWASLGWIVDVVV